MTQKATPTQQKIHATMVFEQFVIPYEADSDDEHESNFQTYAQYECEESELSNLRWNTVAASKVKICFNDAKMRV